MKYVIILFLLFSSTVFSQNYYPLDQGSSPDTEKPTAPLNLAATNITETTADLSWTAATDNFEVTDYRIYNNGVLLVASAGNVTNFTLTDLTQDTDYNITVRAIDAVNNESDASNSAAIKTEAAPDTEKPSAPLNLVATNITETTVDLSWTAASDNFEVTDYRIYNNGVLLIASAGNVTNFTITGLTQDTDYNLTVRAIDAVNNESDDSNTAAVKTEAAPDTEKPSTPLNLVATNIAETTVDLSWTAATDNFEVTDYRIYNNGVLLAAFTGNVTNFSLTGLTQDTDYNLTVRAIDAVNNESDDSNSAVFKTEGAPDTEKPSVPLNLVATNITETTVDLSWTAATDNFDVTDYRIYNNGVLLIASAGNVTSFTITSLTEDTNYNLTVRAIDAANNESDASNTAAFKTEAAPDTEKPSAPLSLVATNITETTTDLSWTAATDNVEVTDYRIYNNGVLLIASAGNVTNFTITGLTQDTDYNITVRAIDAVNNESDDSNTTVFKTEAAPDTEKPSAPLNLVATNFTETTADLSWTAATDNVEVTDYRIYNNGVLLVPSVGNVTSFTITGLTQDTDYNLTVRAIDAVNNESDYSNSAAIKTEAAPDTEKPSAPLNLVATNITETTVDLSWTAATDNVEVTDYKIYNNGVLLIASAGNVTNFTLTGLTQDTDYYLTVRAIDAVNNESDNSNTAAFKTEAAPDTEKPSAPLNLVATNITETTADLSWTAATDNVDVTDYRIYNNGVLLVASAGNVTNFTLTGLTQDTGYNLTVRAIDAVNNVSDNSNSAAIKTEVAPDTEKPSAPLNLVASNITETTADLSWTAATDNLEVTDYRIYNNGVLLIASAGNVTSFKLTGLSEKTNYDLTVRAIDAANNESNQSNNRNFETAAYPDTQRSTMPLNLSGTNITETTVDLEWTASTDNVGVTDYIIYNNGVFIASAGNVTNFTLTNLDPDTAYNLTIRSTDAEGNESTDSNTISFKTLTPPDTEKPSTPLNLEVSNITETTADLTWTASTDNIEVTDYIIYNNGLLIASTGDTTDFTITDLKPDTEYNLTIRAIDAAGNESTDSNTASFKTLTPPDAEKPSTPLNLEVSNITETTADLTWTASTDNIEVMDYIIYNNGEILVNSTENKTSFVLTDLKEDSPYSITARAIDEAKNESDDSNIEDFNTNKASDYSLSSTKRVSIGVFNNKDKLLRTLVTNETKKAGSHKVPLWDGLDDDGINVKDEGSYFKVIANNISDEWEGVIGNSSATLNGNQVWKSQNFPKELLVIEDEMYFAWASNEQDATIQKVKLNDYQNRIDLWEHRVYPGFHKLAWDGETLYMGGQSYWDTNGEARSYISSSSLENLPNYKKWNTFSRGTTVNIFASTYNVADYLEDTINKPIISGLAVQTGADNLFIAREGINSLRVIHKKTGELRKNIKTFIEPKLCKVDKNGYLWLIHGKDSETLEQFSINDTTGDITSTGLTLTNLVDVQSLNLNNDSSIIVIGDKAKYHQLKGYSTKNLSLEWTLGREESYDENATVYNDKFMFGQEGDFNNIPIRHGSVAFETDGSMWVVDDGNERYLKFDAARNYVDQIIWKSNFYTCLTDLANPTRLFSGFKEYQIDYTKNIELGNSNNSWKLVNNWGQKSLLASQNVEAGAITEFKGIETLSNGRTYGMVYDANNIGVPTYRFVEFVNNGSLRDTGVTIDSNRYTLAYTEGGRLTEHLWGEKGVSDAEFYERYITGFDSKNNPIIGDETIYGSLNKDNIPFELFPFEINAETSNGINILFQKQKHLKGKATQIDEYHLAGYRRGDDYPIFKTTKSIKYEVGTDYPLGTNTFDVRDGVINLGSVVLAQDDWFIWGYFGEFWEQTQTNYWHMLSEEGLFLYDFGTDGTKAPFGYEQAEMAGNAFSASVVKVNNQVYLYHNDESFHGGIHRWKINGLDTIEKFVILIE